ncbi:FecR family protein [Pedobacter frigiditerrae]|uniref:FecR family protein n=1 Tax=Pedobacter frigiditerrae TaxID=2530452 RepID=A0A4R0MZ28_9SPHI|nr:FecR domain-containing protein [Pedobacter frigiditerrae]TCC92183.1 FecR family protein [Pedobacter frigiditerrae]
MKNIEAKQLLKKYKEGNCTESDLALLESWYLTVDNEKIDISIEELNEAKSQVWATLPIHKRKEKAIKLWPKLAKVASAAVVLICLSFSLYFYLDKNNNPAKTSQAIVQILPGGKKATLTLANGVSISLNEANIGKIGDQGGSNIFKTEDGQLTYNTSNAAATSQINLLTIPNGGYYNLTLEDGTKVWLNSASSLKYPTVFNENERVVELTGEGYFEVAHNANKPFKVIANNQVVQVLGTHFNINAYHDEKSIATTLAQGSVRVRTKNGTTKVLIPGQQANVIGDLINIKSANVDDETAWIHNEFVFNNEDMGSIMRKISRWYDVEVQCPSDLSRMVFTGSVSRSKNIKQVLRIMELTESIHFKFEGRRITVMP